MPESKRTYRIQNLTLSELNWILSQIGNRLDELEGFRGTPLFQADVDLNKNRIVNVGTATAGTDAVNLGQVPSIAGSDHGGLIGLGDDDHTQYHNNSRGDVRYAPIAEGVTGGDAHDHEGGDGGQIKSLVYTDPDDTILHSIP